MAVTQAADHPAHAELQAVTTVANPEFFLRLMSMIWKGSRIDTRGALPIAFNRRSDAR